MKLVLRGFPTVILNSRSDISTSVALDRLDGALGLLERYVPHHYRRLHRDFSGFLIERRAYRGAFIIASLVCIVELTFVVNRGFSLAQVAATILHEGMHARLYSRGVAIGAGESHRQERFCRRAEIEFGLLVPDGEQIVGRAREALALSDSSIAPIIDPRVAAERVAEVDRTVSRSGHRTD